MNAIDFARVMLWAWTVTMRSRAHGSSLTASIREQETFQVREAAKTSFEFRNSGENLFGDAATLLRTERYNG